MPANVLRRNGFAYLTRAGQRFLSQIQIDPKNCIDFSINCCASIRATFRLPLFITKQMEKHFDFFEGATQQEVMGFALERDAGSRTREHRYLAEPCRLWVLRELLINPRARYIECFELACNAQHEWGLRGWGEEDEIPYTDCPLELLATANRAINHSWRLKVMKDQGARRILPIGSWLHSTTGVPLPGGEVCYDFQFLGDDGFACPSGRRWTLSADVVSRLVEESFGIAAGRS